MNFKKAHKNNPPIMRRNKMPSNNIEEWIKFLYEVIKEHEERIENLELQDKKEKKP